MYILIGEGIGLGQPESTKSLSTNSTSSTTAANSGIPKLVKNIEFSPSLYTMYVDINLNPVWETRRIDGKWKPVCSYAAPVTGIFIPKTYVPQPTVNLILYLHGFKAPCGLSEKATIAQYWSQGFFKSLREDINDSGKNVILVAPTLGPRSGAGKLIKSGEFNTFLDQVLAALNAYNPLNKIPFINRFTKIESIGNIILACHSGGGKPMRAIATLKPSTDSYVTHIRECWGFDCLYNTGDAKEWENWAKTYPKSQLFIYYRNKRDSGTKIQSELLKSQKLGNVCVQCTDTGHCSIPGKYWKERIQQIPCNITPC
jgi:hypothetical protein